MDKKEERDVEVHFSLDRKEEAKQKMRFSSENNNF